MDNQQKNKFKIINKDPVDLKGMEFPVINYSIRIS